MCSNYTQFDHLGLVEIQAFMLLRLLERFVDNGLFFIIFGYTIFLFRLSLLSQKIVSSYTID